MSADAGRLLTRDEILSLLEEVADRLDARGVGVDAYIIGGLAMAVQHDASQRTSTGCSNHGRTFGPSPKTSPPSGIFQRTG